MLNLLSRKVVANRFEIVKVSESGMSSMCEALDRETGATVILKTAAKSDFDRAFALIREREILVRLDHPGIVKTLALIEEDEHVFLVEEKVEGNDLGTLLRLGDMRFTEKEARDYCKQLCEILTHLHTQSPPIIYRDLKPSNIMLRPDGRLVLIDFGAARVKTSASRDTVSLGTPGYAAPEQYGSATDERTDLYGLGVTLYELLTRCDPTDFSFRFPVPAELGVKLSPEFETVLLRLLDPDPQRRFASAQAIHVKEAPAPRSMLLTRVAAALAIVGLLGVVGFVPGLARNLAGTLLFLIAVGLTTPAAVWTELLMPVDAPRFQRRFHLIALAVGCSCVASLPLLIPSSVSETLLRRAALFSGSSAVPFAGPPLLWMMVGIWMLLAGFLSGHALSVRRGWKPLALLMCSTASCILTLGYSLAVQDSGAQASTSYAAAWSTELQMTDMPRRDMMLIGRDMRDRSILFLRTGDQQSAFYEASSGRLLWNLTASAGQMHFQNGIAFGVDDKGLIAYDVTNGSELWKAKLGAPLLRIWPGRELTMAVKNGTIEEMDWTTRKLLWRHVIPAHVNLMSGIGFVPYFDVDASRAVALSHTDGAELWSTVLPNGPYFDGFDFGDRWVARGAHNLVVLQSTTGKVLLDMSTLVGLTSSQPEARFLDADHLLVSFDRTLCLLGLNADGASLLWKKDMGAACFLHQTPSGKTYLTARSGTVLGLDAYTGRVEWEWSPGGVLAHLWPPSANAFTFSQPQGARLWMQPVGGHELLGLSLDTGRIVQRIDLPQGSVVEGLCDGTAQVFLTVRDASGTSHLQAIRWLSQPETPQRNIDPMSDMQPPPPAH